MSDLDSTPISDALKSPIEDDFPSLEELRVTDDNLDGVKAAKIITTVPVGKPPKSSFFRTHRSPDYWQRLAILELEESRETFLVLPGAQIHTMGLSKLCLVVPYITLNGHVGLWTIKTSSNNAWNESAQDAAQRARDHWVRLASGQGQYDVFIAQAAIPDPTWPDLSPLDFLRAGFRTRIIRDASHEVIRKLAGEQV